MNKLVYQNPIGVDVIKRIRDPFILLEGDTYYLTGTIPPFWDGTSEGVKLWKSDDLLAWSEQHEGAIPSPGKNIAKKQIFSVNKVEFYIYLYYNND